LRISRLKLHLYPTEDGKGTAWRDAYGGQVWNMASDILDKQSLTTVKKWPSGLGDNTEANNPPSLKLSMLRNVEGTQYRSG
jgi:hypothetical protein